MSCIFFNCLFKFIGIRFIRLIKLKELPVIGFPDPQHSLNINPLPQGHFEFLGIFIWLSPPFELPDSLTYRSYAAYEPVKQSHALERYFSPERRRGSYNNFYSFTCYLPHCLTKAFKSIFQPK